MEQAVEELGREVQGMKRVLSAALVDILVRLANAKLVKVEQEEYVGLESTDIESIKSTMARLIEEGNFADEPRKRVAADPTPVVGDALDSMLYDFDDLEGYSSESLGDVVDLGRLSLKTPPPSRKPEVPTTPPPSRKRAVPPPVMREVPTTPPRRHWSPSEEETPRSRKRVAAPRQWNPTYLFTVPREVRDLAPSNGTDYVVYPLTSLDIPQRVQATRRGIFQLTDSCLASVYSSTNHSVRLSVMEYVLLPRNLSKEEHISYVMNMVACLCSNRYYDELRSFTPPYLANFVNTGQKKGDLRVGFQAGGFNKVGSTKNMLSVWLWENWERGVDEIVQSTGLLLETYNVKL